MRDFYVNGGARAVIVRLTSPNFLDANACTQFEDAAKTIADAATATDGKTAKKNAQDAYDSMTKATPAPAPDLLLMADRANTVIQIS